MRGAVYKIFKYTLFDLLRSRWLFSYAVLIGLMTAGLLYLGDDPTQAAVSVLNLVILVVPLVSLVLGLMYHYANRDFTLLVLTQPVARGSVFWGQFWGLGLSLTGAYLLGVLAPFAAFAVLGMGEVDWPTVGMLLFVGAMVTLVFTSLALYLGVGNDERVRALGVAIAVWFVLTFVYDSLLLAFIILAQAYPIDRWVIGISMLNPVDLARVLVLLHLDTAALMGYTGALFKKFLGSGAGTTAAALALVLWAAVPAVLAGRVFARKDF